jgi:hypothetical protein
VVMPRRNPNTMRGKDSRLSCLGAIVGTRLLTYRLHRFGLQRRFPIQVPE